MTFHTLDADARCFRGRFCADHRPILVVDPGDRVRLRIPADVGWGLGAPTDTTSPRPKLDPREPGPAMVGPIAVRGARPGDLLEVRVLAVDAGPWGWTYAGGPIGVPWLKAAVGGEDAPLVLRRWTIDAPVGLACSPDGLRVPLAPFPGILGVCPGAGTHDAWRAWSTGGNLDCPLLRAGSTLFVPVRVDDALLYAGDGHAAQGEGEIAGTAIECALERFEFEVRLHRRMLEWDPPVGPFLDSTEGLSVLVSDSDLQTAIGLSVGAMARLMTRAVSAEGVEVLAALSPMVDVGVAQVVNPTVTARATLRRAAMIANGWTTHRLLGLTPG